MKRTFSTSTCIVVAICFLVTFFGEWKISAKNEIIDSTAISEKLESLIRINSEGLSAKADQEIVWRHLRDGNEEVQSAACLTLSVISVGAEPPQDGRYTLTTTDAATFASYLEKCIEDSDLPKFKLKNGSNDPNILTLRRILAFATLNQFYALMSPRTFHNWQDQVLRTFMVGLYLDQEIMSETEYNTFLGILNTIEDANALAFILDSLIIRLDELTWDRLQITLLALWKHPVLGQGYGMNPILVNILYSKLDFLSVRMLRETKPNSDFVQFEGMLQDITELGKVFHGKSNKK